MFLDIVFPKLISKKFEGGPIFKTFVYSSESAYEQRIQVWEEPIYQYTVDAMALNKNEFEKLLGFFYIVKGRQHSFRFKDWSDHYVEAQALGVVDQAPATLQAVKVYRTDNMSYVRKITKLAKNNVHVFVNGVETQNVEIDYNTGMITVHETGLVSWTGEFHVHCRFDTDSMTMSADVNNPYLRNQTISIRSVRS
ncbi:MAG TPA: DUF2460 domain-containing protein [Fervidobacterium sp.]|nr:DUF2460 domain-containing protein [Fervidobacterium sp.]